MTRKVSAMITRVRPQSAGNLLSTLWIYVLLSMLFRDMHEILRQGFIEELATVGTVRGTEVSATTLVLSGLVLQLPLAMVVGSRLLPPRANRVANVVVAVVMSAGLLGTWPKDGDDLVFGGFQLLALLAVVAIAIRGRLLDGHDRLECKERPGTSADPEPALHRSFT